MKSYFIFDNLIESELLAGAKYDEFKTTSSKETKGIFQKRINNWNQFVEISQKTRKPLIILINGCSNSGKSTWAIEMARRLGIRNVIHTDTIRSILRQFYSKKIDSPIHSSTYHCWSVYSESFSPDILVKGFNKQSELIISYLYSSIDEAIDYGKFTIIEGMHLIPSLLDMRHFESSYVLQLFLSVESELVQKERLESRFNSNYFNRNAQKYDSHSQSFQTLREYLAEQAELFSIKSIKNENASQTLDDMMLAIHEFIEQVIAREVKE